MIARNITGTELFHVAQSVGVTLDHFDERGSRRTGPVIRFRLALQPGRRFGRRSPSGRRVAAVCWHGHYRFFVALFTKHPHVTVETTMLRHNAPGDKRYTRENFARLYLPTGYQNIGSAFAPIQYREACDCVNTGDYIIDETALSALNG